MLQGSPDARFLSYEPVVAGRAVIVHLFGARKGATRERHQATWQRYQRLGVDLIELGRAAKILENAGIDWRRARRHSNILEAAKQI